MRYDKARLLVAALLLANLTWLAPAASAAGCSLTGAGTEQDPYEISSEADLTGVMDCSGSGKYFLLTQSIAITSPWTPLGSSISPFVGNFDGGGHTISGVVIEDHTPNEDANIYRDGVGLFRWVKDSVFENFQLNVHVAMTNFQPLTTITRGSVPAGTPEPGALYGVGAVSGYADNSTFKEISSQLRLDDASSVSGYSKVGGLVGMALKREFRINTNDGSILSVTDEGTEKLELLSVTSRVEYSNSVRGFGGLIGYARMDSGKALVISESSALIIQSGNGNYANSPDGAGGLVGDLAVGNLSIEDSYAVATIRLVNDNSKNVGGLVGRVPATNTSTLITSSYAVLSVPGHNAQSQFSSMVGSGANITISNSFWNSEITTVSGTAGATGATTAQLKTASTFENAGWDIKEGFDQAATWGIHPAVNDGYPFLTGNYSSDPTPAAPSYTAATSFNISDGTVEVGTLTTTPTSQWTVSNDASGFFSIDSQTGELTVSPSAAPGNYPVTVKFTGSNTGFGTQVLSITIAAPQVEQGAQVIAPMPAVPEITEFSSREIRSTGDSVTLTGRRLAGVSTLTLGGITVTIVSNTATSLTFTTGEMPVGVWDLRLVGSNGTLVFQQAIEVVEATAIVAESTGELLGYTWTLKFLGNSRSLSDAQQSHAEGELALHPDTTTVICWGYTTAASPNAWAIAHATQRAQAACDMASANNSEVKTVVRLRYGVSKNWAMRSALQFWR